MLLFLLYQAYIMNLFASVYNPLGHFRTLLCNVFINIYLPGFSVFLSAVSFEDLKASLKAYKKFVIIFNRGGVFTFVSCDMKY